MDGDETTSTTHSITEILKVSFLHPVPRPHLLLAHDGDGLVARVPLSLVETLDELQEASGGLWAVMLRPQLIVIVSHCEPLTWSAISL